jgi:hypothetical protein
MNIFFSFGGGYAKIPLKGENAMPLILYSVNAYLAFMLNERYYEGNTMSGVAKFLMPAGIIN